MTELFVKHNASPEVKISSHLPLVLFGVPYCLIFDLSPKTVIVARLKAGVLGCQLDAPGISRLLTRSPRQASSPLRMPF